MSVTKWILTTAIGAVLLLVGSTTANADPLDGASDPAATASTKGRYFNSWGTCRNSKPFKPPRRHCRYDDGRRFRGTFVLKSKVGRTKMKACFRIYSRPPLGGGHACRTTRMYLRYKAIPFVISGIRQGFKVRFIWFAKRPAAGKKFRKVGVSWMGVRP